MTTTKNYDDSIFLNEWTDAQKSILSKMYPEIPEDKLEKFIKETAKKRVVKTPCVVDNNYVKKSVNSNLVDIYDWVKTTKPICGGFGVFFKNHSQTSNPTLTMLLGFLERRTFFKKQLKDHHESSEEYKMLDMKQANEKINVNSFYGGSGNKKSRFYNVYTATCTTATGQSLTSTTELAFEAFLTNNVKFNRIDECFTYMENIINEKYKINPNFLKDVTLSKLTTHLINMFHEPKEEYKDMIRKYLAHLSQTQLNKIYYKNNLYEFSKHPQIMNILRYIVKYTKSFVDPNRVPKETEKELNLLWDYYKEFVFYNYFYFERIERFRNDKRRCVVAADTDSNILTVNEWVDFIEDNVISVSNNFDKNKDEKMYLSVNIIAFILTNMIACVLKKYTKLANIPKDYRKFIKMKNEFLFEILILASKKKRYISVIRLREGMVFDPPKLNVMGHDFIKSTINKQASERLQKITKKYLCDDNIDINGMLLELSKFENEIYDSLKKGEKVYTSPKSVKELGAYKDPFSQQGMRAVIAWNLIYPDRQIELPTNMDMIKVNLTTMEEIEPLKKSHPDIYKTIVKKIFNHKEKSIASKGINVIAIPRNEERIPEWIIPYIDYETIVVDNISKFYPVLESIGIEIVSTSKHSFFSNIIHV